MAKLKEEALAYETKQTKNIAELPEVSVDLDLEDDEFEAEDDKGNLKMIKQKITMIDGERYVVKNSVLKQLKVFLEDNSNIKKFSSLSKTMRLD